MAKFELRTGVYSTSLSLAAAGALVVWPNDPIIGYILFGSAAVLALWGVRFKGVGLVHILRGPRARQMAYAERSVFDNETIQVADLVNDALPMVFGKHFRRCVISGPAHIWFKNHCRLMFVSAEPGSFVQVYDGAEANGAVAFYDVVFDRCYFDDVVVEVIPRDYATLVPQVRFESFLAWKQRR